MFDQLVPATVDDPFTGALYVTTVLAVVGTTVALIARMTLGTPQPALPAGPAGSAPPVPIPAPKVDGIPADYLARRMTQIAQALGDHLGVGLYAILQQVRDDGYPDLADALVVEIGARAAHRASRDPALFATLVHVATAPERSRTE